MALAANAERTASPAPEIALEVTDAAEMYAGAYVGVNVPTHGTADSRGRCVPFNDANFVAPLGFGLQRKTGAIAATPIPKDSIDVGPQVRVVDVTGGSSREKIMSLVYATDDGTFTLTRPAVGFPIGFVVDWLTGTNCKVYFYSMGELGAIALAGAGKKLLCLGSVALVLAAAGDLLKGILAPCHGLITAVYAICLRLNTDADVHMDAQLEINGTNVTGGVVTFDFADTVALKKAGTAITGLNEVHEGDLIDFEALAAGLVAGTATDVGTYNVYIEIQPLLGQ